MTTPKHTEESTDDQVSTALVEAEPREVSLTRALHINTHFQSEAIRSDAAPGMLRRLTWLTGNNQCFSINGKQALPPGKGWIIDQPDEEAGLYPDDYELIEAMEELCAQGKAASCIVVHPENGKPRRVLSWALPLLSLFVICQGIPSRDMMRDPQTRWGVAYGWNPRSNRSELYFQCFIKELLDVGYAGVFLAKFSGLITGKALDCLYAHNYALKFADRLRSQGDIEGRVPYYAYAMPITCAQRTLTAGREGQSTEVYYPIPCIPRLSLRDPESGLAYLENVAITLDQAALLEADNRVENTVAWSIEKTRRINGGDEDPADTAPAPDDPNVPF